MEKLAKCVLKHSKFEVWPNTLHVMLSVLYMNEQFKFEVAYADTNQAGYLTGRGRGVITFDEPDKAFREYDMRVETNRSMWAISNNQKLNTL